MLDKDVVAFINRIRPALRLGALVAAFLIACGARAWAYPFFVPPATTFPSAGVVVYLAIGDLNGDGHADIVTANGAANVVCVLLGAGNGTFAIPILTPTGAYAQAVAVGDINGDGAQDVVVGLANAYGVLIGNGDGTFAPIATYAFAGGVYEMRLCALNGDAIPDLFVISSNAHGLASYLGNGDGSFGAAQVRSDFIPQNGVAVGDLNGDGRLDAVVSTGDCDGEMWRVLGNGDGSFGPKLQFDAIQCNPFPVSIADVTGDGKPDAVTSLLGTRSLSVYPGAGDGTFGARQSFALASPGFSMGLADFNADGRTDVIAASVSPSAVSLLLGSPTGLQPRQDCAVGGALHALAIGDFNGDGRPDVAVGGGGSPAVSILLNTGGLFPTAVPTGEEAGSPFALRVAPSPLVSGSRAVFVLPTRAAVHLRVFDLAGRRLAQRDLGELGPGAHEAPLGLASGVLRPGFYLVELRAGDQAETVGAAFVQ